MGAYPALAIDNTAPRTPLEEYSRVAGLKTMLLQQQQAQLQLQQQQQAQADRAATTKAMLAWDGKSYDDLAKSVLQSGGSAAAAQAIQKHGLDIRDTASQIAQRDAETGSKHIDTIIKQHDQVLGALQAAEQVPDEQLGAHLSETVNSFAKSGMLEPDLAQKAMALAQLPPDQARQALKLFEKNLIGQEEQFDQADKTAQRTLREKELNLQSQRLQAEMPGGALEPVDRRELNAYLKNPNLKGETIPVGQRDAATFASWKAKQSPMGLVVGNQLGPAGPGTALDQAAEKYFQSGDLPSGLSRSPGTMTAIMQRAAELHPDANLAGNKAIFGANKKALGELQAQFSKVSAFEGTALRNLDLYVQKAKAIPDLQVKFLDVPLRMLTKDMIGEKNMAAMEAARQTAATETAKVLGSATASGVLSDTQKKEALDVINGNLPLAATIEVVNTLKQDFANRHQSYSIEIGNLQKALGGQGGGSSNTGTQPTVHKVGDIIVQGGQRFKATAVDANGKVTAADPI